MLYDPKEIKDCKKSKALAGFSTKLTIFHSLLSPFDFTKSCATLNLGLIPRQNCKGVGDKPGKNNNSSKRLNSFLLTIHELITVTRDNL